MIDILFPDTPLICPLISVVNRGKERLILAGFDHWANGEITPYYIPYVPIWFSLVSPFPTLNLEDIDF